MPDIVRLGMRQFRDFFMSALVGGMVILIPIYLGVLLVLKAMHSLLGLVRPLAALLPEWFPAEKTLSLLLVLSVCFLVGLAARTSIGRAVRHRLEDGLLRRIPGYQLFQGLIQQLAGGGQGQVWKPALAEIEEALVPAFIIEEFDDGRFTVFVPSVPTPLSGAIYILSRERVHPLDVSFTQVVKAVSQWGSGCKDLVGAIKTENYVG